MIPTSPLVIQGDISPRIMSRIDAIVAMNEAWHDRIVAGEWLQAAEAYQKAGMPYIAAKLRRRAGVKINRGRSNGKVPGRVKEKTIAIIQAHGRICPDDCAGELGISRSTFDKVAKQLRLDGRIRLYAHRFLEIVKENK